MIFLLFVSLGISFSRKIKEDVELLSFSSASGNYADSNYVNAHKIKPYLFSYNSTGDRPNHPISYVFDGGSEYWVSKNEVSQNDKSSIFIYFKRTISLEAFLYDTAFSTDGNNRYYHGFPQKLNVYASIGNEPFKLHAIFSGDAPTLKAWGALGQFVFNEPFICDKIQLEFENVTLDDHFTHQVCAVTHGITLLGSVAQSNYEKTSGVYANSEYVNTYAISDFTYSSSGDDSAKPIANAFDNNDGGTYWVAKDESTDNFHSTITVNFGKSTTLKAILLAPAYRTNKGVTPNTRGFEGFPTILNVHSSSNNEQLKLQAVFAGDPSGTTDDDWKIAQLVFRTPITCDKLQLEFVEVTPDGFFSDGRRRAVVGGLKFIKPGIKHSAANGTFTDAFINNNKIPPSFFNYSSTGDMDNHPISAAFDGKAGQGTAYWVAKNPCTESSTSSIYINFKRPVSLNTILIDTAFSTTGVNRVFFGFPLKLNIYASLGLESLSLKYTYQGVAPTLTSYGTKIQLSFIDNIECDKLRIEFVEVTLDSFFSHLYCAVANEITFIGTVSPEAVALTAVDSAFEDQAFLQNNLITTFKSQSNGDYRNHPLTNAFDSNSGTYWVASQENTDNFRSTIIIDFNGQTSLEGFLFDSAFRSNEPEKTRSFEGFPKTIIVSASVDGSDLFIPEAVFSGDPKYPWKRTQMIFKNPVKCRKLKIEFDDITYDGFFSKKKCAVSGGIYFLREFYKLPQLPSAGGDVEVDSNMCNQFYRCDINVTNNKPVTLTIKESTFNKYTSKKDGGAISLINCGSTLQENNFIECTSVKGGGAIFFQNDLNLNTELDLIRVKFTNCKAVYGGAAYLYSRRTNVTVHECEFKGCKLIAPSESSGAFQGGSALFVTVEKADFDQLKFDGCDDVVVKFYNNYDNKPNSKVLSNKQNLVLFSRCSFNVKKETDSPIYFVRGNNRDSLFKVSDCTFNGKLAKGVHYIDGEFISNDSPKLIVESCKFSVSLNEALNLDPNNNVLSINLNNQIPNYSKAKQSKASWKEIITGVTPAALVAVIAIIVAVLIVKKRRTSTNDAEMVAENELNLI